MDKYAFPYGNRHFPEKLSWGNSNYTSGYDEIGAVPQKFRTKRQRPRTGEQMEPRKSTNHCCREATFEDAGLETHYFFTVARYQIVHRAQEELWGLPLLEIVVGHPYIAY